MFSSQPISSYRGDHNRGLRWTSVSTGTCIAVNEFSIEKSSKFVTYLAALPLSQRDEISWRAILCYSHWWTPADSRLGEICRLHESKKYRPQLRTQSLPQDASHVFAFCKENSRKQDNQRALSMQWWTAGSKSNFCQTYFYKHGYSNFFRSDKTYI